MRILTVGNWYPPHHWGGYEQVWSSAVAHLREHGHQVRVLACDYRHPDVADGEELDVYRDLRWYWREHEFARVAVPERVRIERHNHRILKRHLNELDADVVGFWAMGGMSHSLLEAVRCRRVPAVAFIADQWLDYGRTTDQWLRIFDRRKWLPSSLVARVVGVPTHVDYGRAARYVFASDFLRCRALSLPLELTSTAIAHLGIASLFLSDEYSRPPWGWRLLHVGRLHPDKGIQDAVAAMAHLPEEATLAFVGTWDPRDETELRRLIAQLGFEERVQLLGQMPRERIAEMYREYDVALFPVRWDEPWGLVPLEAMASGCPVVATGRGGSAEYLRDGENCLVVAAEAPDALAAAVRRLAGSPALRERLRSGGRRTAPLYTEAAFNAAVERHLAEMAGADSRQAAGAAT